MLHLVSRGSHSSTHSQNFLFTNDSWHKLYLLSKMYLLLLYFLCSVNLDHFAQKANICILDQTRRPKWKLGVFTKPQINIFWLHGVEGWVQIIATNGWTAGPVITYSCQIRHRNKTFVMLNVSKLQFCEGSECLLLTADALMENKLFMALSRN